MQAKENLVETTHFVGLGVEIEKVLTLKYISSRFGRLPKESFEKLSAYKDNPYVDFIVNFLGFVNRSKINAPIM